MSNEILIISLCNLMIGIVIGICIPQLFLFLANRKTVLSKGSDSKTLEEIKSMSTKQQLQFVDQLDNKLRLVSKSTKI